jgi:hypothetical protein
MLLVILGAGASYDSVPAYPPPARLEYRPPLADDLFDNREHFRQAISVLPKCQSIVPLLQRRHGLSLEQRLQELAGEANEYPMRYQQLMAIRYYIQRVLWDVNHTWVNQIAASITNQKALLDQINRWRTRGDNVCIVTFNYDRIIEEALTTVGISITAFADYVTHEFKLFKLHGSIDWARRTGILSNTDVQQNAMELVIERAAELNVRNQFEMVAEYPSAVLSNELVVPAIAIPLEDNRFRMPS